MSDRRRTGPLLAALVALGIAAAFVWALRPVPVEVETVTVRRGPLAGTIEAEGITRVRAPWTISAPIAGTLGRPPVATGDPVTAEVTVVATLRPSEPPMLDARSRAEAEAAVDEAEAATELARVRLRQADEAVAYAESQLARIRILADRGAATQTQLEAALRDAAAAARDQQAARSGLDLAAASLARAEVQLLPPGAEGETAACCLDLRAPLDGIVLAQQETESRLVPAGTPLLTVGDLADMEIEADVLSTDAVRIRPGAKAVIEGWGGEGRFEARVSRVDPSARTEVSALGIEERRVTVHLDLLTPPEARAGLGDRFRVLVRITLWEVPDALQLPTGALFRQGEGWVVCRVEAGRTRIVPVEIGRIAADAVEVLGGLAEGDTVILYPPDGIGEGTRVVAREAPAFR